MRASYLTILCSRPAGDPCLDAVLGLVCSDNWALTSLGGRPGGPASLMHRLPASVGTLTLKKKRFLACTSAFFSFSLTFSLLLVRFQATSKTDSGWRRTAPFSTSPSDFRFVKCFWNYQLDLRIGLLQRVLPLKMTENVKIANIPCRFKLVVASYRHRLPQNLHISLWKCGPAGSVSCVSYLRLLVFDACCISFSSTPFCLTHFLALF